MKTHIVRSVVALATVLTSLLVLPTPASATTFVSNGNGPTGALYLTNPPTVPPLTVPLSAAPTICPSSSVEVDVTPTATPPASFDITALDLQSVVVAGTPATSYVALMTRVSSTPGTSDSINPITGATLSLRLVLHTLTGTCTPGSIVCVFTMTFAVTGTHSGFPVVSSNTTVVLEGALTAVTRPFLTPCFVPFAPYTGGQAQFSFMGFELI